MAPQAAILSPIGKRFARFLRDFQRTAHGHYRFMDSTEYQSVLRNDVTAGMKVYWMEILYRAHANASMALLRTDRWLRGMLATAESKNYLAFCAAFRGLIESSADSFHTHHYTLENLADPHVVIRRAISGRLDVMTLSPHLEDALIHFSHARRLQKGEAAPASHRAEHTTTYLSHFASATDANVQECYQLLCQLTHPAAQSVHVFLSDDSSHESVRLSPGKDRVLMAELAAQQRDVIDQVISVGMVPAVYQLRVLNMIGPPEMRTNLVDDFGPPDSEVWKALQARLSDDAMPRMQTNPLTGDKHRR